MSEQLIFNYADRWGGNELKWHGQWNPANGFKFKATYLKI